MGTVLEHTTLYQTINEIVQFLVHSERYRYLFGEVPFNLSPRHVIPNTLRYMMVANMLVYDTVAYDGTLPYIRTHSPKGQFVCL